MSFTNIRYKLVPQMKEYDRIGQIWLPYLMYFHMPNYSSNVVNIDSKGFRVTYKNSNRISDFKNIEGWPICLLVGGSNAFGVGATSDKKTISSILSAYTDYLWLNFGGRAFNSTQELLLFLLYRHNLRDIKKIVILSGLNNLILFHLSRYYSKELGPFFYWNEYNRAMNYKVKSVKRISAILSGIVYGNRRKRQTMLNSSVSSALFKPISDHEREKEDLLSVFERDISSWKLLTESSGIELYFVLQPFSNWISKRLTNEEELLFQELDKHPRNVWRIIKDKINYELYIWLLKHIREICESSNIKFFDLNESISNEKLDGKWLYVDRAHFNDEGNQIISKILIEKVIRK